MVETHFLSAITVRDIQEEKRTTDKNRAIIDRVRTSGPKGYQKFLQMLKTSGNEFIYDMLKEKEEEIAKREAKKPPAKAQAPKQVKLQPPRLPNPNVIIVQDVISSEPQAATSAESDGFNPKLVQKPDLAMRKAEQQMLTQPSLTGATSSDVQMPSLVAVTTSPQPMVAQPTSTIAGASRQENEQRPSQLSMPGSSLQGEFGETRAETSMPPEVDFSNMSISASGNMDQTDARLLKKAEISKAMPQSQQQPSVRYGYPAASGQMQLPSYSQQQPVLRYSGQYTQPMQPLSTAGAGQYSQQQPGVRYPAPYPGQLYGPLQPVSAAGDMNQPVYSLPVTDAHVKDLIRQREEYQARQMATNQEGSFVRTTTQPVPPRPVDSDQTDSTSRMGIQTPANGSQVSLPSAISSTLAVNQVFFETLTEKKTRCMFEGRILTIDKSWCERAVQNLKSFDGGGYGEVFLVKHPEATEMSVVIKRIKCQTDDDKARSAVSEILASRLLHFTIVPVWAMAEDSLTYYLMLPYFENKSLAYNLSKDRKTIENRQKDFVQKLNKPARLRILYQVACAMAFLHRGIQNFRRSVVHGDITTRNIVLDKKGNARLIDFGLAREYSQGKVGVTLKTTDMRGTPGYFQTVDTGRLTVGKDVFNFFVVILEVLTSMPPCYGSNESQKLKNKFIENSSKKHIFLEDFEREIEAVWGRFAADIFPTRNNPAVDKLLQLAEKCRNETASEVLKEDLDSLVSEYCQRRWEDPQSARDDNKKQCVVCLINPVHKDARNTLGHTEVCKLYVCVACMRNSYLNPIECHSCGLTVQPPIGHKWAAVLVAGNDLNKKIAAEAFAGDLKKIKKAITSRHPMIMGISERDVFTAQPKEPGTAEELLPKVKAAFDSLAQIEAGQCIESLLFYFTGHHSENQGFKLGDNSEYMKREELEKYLNEAVAKCGCKRVFVLLDCCNAPAVKLNLSCAFFQINACIPGENAEFPEGEGSAFTEFFSQCLRAKSSSDMCLLGRKKGLSSCSYCEGFTSSNGFMKLHALCDCVKAHVVEYDRLLGSTNSQQVRLMSDSGGTDDVIGYFIDKAVSFEFALQHEGTSMTHMVAQLPETLQELQQSLFDVFTVQQNRGQEPMAFERSNDNDGQEQAVFGKLSSIMGVMRSGEGPLHASKIAQMSGHGRSKSSVNRELYELRERGILTCDDKANWTMVKSVSAEELQACAANLAKKPPSRKAGNQVTRAVQGQESFLAIPKSHEFADMLAIKIQTGPRAENHQELDTLEKIESAWNGKRSLCVTLRQLGDLQNGRVGRFVGSGEAVKVLDLLKTCTGKNGQTLCQHLEEERADLVIASLNGGGVRKLWRCVRNHQTSDIGLWTHLTNELNSMKEDLKDRNTGQLVFTFPKRDQDGNRITNFYSIHIEP